MDSFSLNNKKNCIRAARSGGEHSLAGQEENRITALSQLMAVRHGVHYPQDTLNQSEREKEQAKCHLLSMLKRPQNTQPVCLGQKQSDTTKDSFHTVCLGNKGVSPVPTQLSIVTEIPEYLCRHRS